jgi:hypothetical protein
MRSAASRKVRMAMASMVAKRRSSDRLPLHQQSPLQFDALFEFDGASTPARNVSRNPKP